MKNTKKKDYSGVEVYIGIDVHKKSWETKFVIDSVNKQKARFEKPILHIHNISKYPQHQFQSKHFHVPYNFVMAFVFSFNMEDGKYNFPFTNDVGGNHAQQCFSQRRT